MEKNGCVMNGSFEDNASSSANGAVPKLPVRQDLCDGNSLSCQPLPPVVKRNNQLHLANLAGGEGRWSVEENSLITDEDSSSLTNGVSSDFHVNGLHGCQRNFQLNRSTSPVKNNCHMLSAADQNNDRKLLSDKFLLSSVVPKTSHPSCNGFTSNNNISSFDSLVTSPEKYDFPFKLKINNNSCPGSRLSNEEEGMEFFKQCQDPQHHSDGEKGASFQPFNIKNQSPLHPEYAINRTDDKPLTTTTITTATVTGGTTREVRTYDNEHLNLLNGDDYEDEDGCIYTYKEVPGFEDNLLDHLLTTCVSCGLPNLDNPPHKVLADEASASPDHEVVFDHSGKVNQPNINGENVFSPDMDFLEMDFDPNTDYLESSDCEDNCFPNIQMEDKGARAKVSSIAFKKQLASPLLMNNKANNLSPERMSLMLCKRCENDPTINGRTDNFPLKYVNKVGFNFATPAPLDKRLRSIDSNSGTTPRKIDNKNLKSNVNGHSIKTVINPVEFNLPQGEKPFCSSVDAMQQKPNISDKVEERSNTECKGSKETSCPSNSFVSPTSSKVLFNYSGTSSESNVKEESRKCCCCKTSGNCRKYNLAANLKVLKKPPDATSSQSNVKLKPNLSLDSSLISISESSNAAVKSHSKSSRLQCKNNINKDNKSLDSDSSSNNNLGSLSAPEVSPAHELPNQDRVKRSVSFHNQLSSPKYDNVCFPTNCHPGNADHTLHNIMVEHPNISCDHSSSLNSYLRNHRHSHPCEEHNNILLYSRPNGFGDVASHNINHLKSRGPSRAPNSTSEPVSSQHENGMDSSPLCSTQKTPADNTANISACTNRLQSRETAVFNIVVESEPNTRVVVHPSQNGCPNSDKISSLVVKGSLPPKNNDPLLDVNTTPATTMGGEESCPRVQEKVMVWTERQAIARQVLQTERSTCGLSAVANVLLALEQHNQPLSLGDFIRPSLRAESAPLVQYLVSRSKAGTTHQQLIDGLVAATKGSIVAKFFPMFPKRAVQLSKWLSGWISKGGVCVCTLNLQCGVSPGETIPDAWHHQMVFGVGPQGIYLTNPVECVCEEMISTQLCSERVLLVKREDVIRHWSYEQSLVDLLTQQDPRWRNMNVLGQVSLVLKEDMAVSLQRGRQRGRQHLTSHVAIPAAYHSGITVFMRGDNPHSRTLLQAQDLPLLE